MSYYKIMIESDSLEGLKAIQGGFFSQGAGATISTASESLVSPPPQQDEENLDAFSSVMQAPPTADEAGASADFSDESALYPPPPDAADNAMDMDLAGETPPPQKDKP